MHIAEVPRFGPSGFIYIYILLWNSCWEFLIEYVLALVVYIFIFWGIVVESFL
jgi:hypothetical protein